MAKFKAIVRYQRPDGYYTVYIRVAHNKRTQYIKTDKVVNSKGIDKNNYVCDPFVMKYCANKIAIYTLLSTYGRNAVGIFVYMYKKISLSLGILIHIFRWEYFIFYHYDSYYR